MLKFGQQLGVQTVSDDKKPPFFANSESEERHLGSWVRRARNGGIPTLSAQDLASRLKPTEEIEDPELRKLFEAFDNLPTSK